MNITKKPFFWEKKTWVSWSFLPLSCIWSLGARARHWMVRPRRVSVRVLCVGNVVVGGAGKTPVVRRLACDLTAAGERPHILVRGYGGVVRGPLRVDPERHRAYHVGDEALELAEVAPVWVGRRREQTAALAQKHGASVLIMDDGFQNPGLYKNFSFLVIDRHRGLGNGYVMPAGPLRESFYEAQKRAQAVIVLGVRGEKEGILPSFDVPCLRAQLVCPPCKGDVVAFAGIGSGEKFFRALGASGARVVASKNFGDHHVYTQKDADMLHALSVRYNAPLLTTKKDMARLQGRTDVTLAQKAQGVEATVVFEDEPAWRELLETFL